ncbi:TLC domain-containing protein 4-B-like [Mya arenaria]|uniref:TLC domain-containing protein 4-B-like n=1 Tax=Mya arenaria TaxID=6604 RepID=UPI0022E34EC6|nr:TLC domain-containing protein 4-B-like [Mya arenaria]XP_052774800.1 TLC domain-containing protein 4-B-like [Mya arenaria]XP_052775657.1 TLC domain-containing protein 4-B-like [Mya arenaria]XP_052775658.1 TLC domain-containing protein 4-B-like [Mya arenaria]
MGLEGLKLSEIPIDWSYYPVSGVSCLVGLLLYYIAVPAFNRVFIPRVFDLPIGKQIWWYSSALSSIHAVVVSCLCVYTLVFNWDLIQDPVWADSKVVKTTCAILIGYMMADMIILVLNLNHIGDRSYVLHHAASVFAYFYVTAFGVYVFFANFRLMAEFSTVFVNNRWMLDALGMKSTRLYFWNGVVLTAVFFACRIVTLPPCWYLIYTIIGTDGFNRTEGARYVLVLSCIVLDTLNILWFYKLLKGVVKQLQKVDSNKNTVADLKSE